MPTTVLHLHQKRPVAVGMALVWTWHHAALVALHNSKQRQRQGGCAGCDVDGRGMDWPCRCCGRRTCRTWSTARRRREVLGLQMVGMMLLCAHQRAQSWPAASVKRHAQHRLQLEPPCLGLLRAPTCAQIKVQKWSACQAGWEARRKFFRLTRVQQHWCLTGSSCGTVLCHQF